MREATAATQPWGGEAEGALNADKMASVTSQHTTLLQWPLCNPLWRTQPHLLQHGARAGSHLPTDSTSRIKRQLCCASPVLSVGPV